MTNDIFSGVRANKPVVKSDEAAPTGGFKPPQKESNKVIEKLKSFYQKHTLPVLIVAAALLLILVGGIVYFAISRSGGNSDMSDVQREYQERLPELSQAVSEDPESAEARKAYAVALYATGDKQTAQAQYEEAARLNDQDSVVFNNLGNVYRDNDETEKAVEAYKRSIELNSTAVNPYVNLANVQLYTQEDADAAISTYQQALRALPENTQIELLLAAAQEQKGDSAAARATYQNILSRDENNAAAQAGLERLN